MKYVSNVPKNADTETRERILQTAKLLLRRHGGGKLTVVDIARALKMSHANVYRFYRSKSAIFDAIIDEWLAALEAFVENIARRPAPAAERLEAVVLELHRKRKEKLLQDVELFETYRRVIEARPDAVAQRRAKMVGLFKRLLAEGVAAGEFESMDCQQAAVVLEDATALFLHPLLIPITLHEPMGKRAKNVVRLFIAGFAANPPPRVAIIPVRVIHPRT